MCEWQFEPTLIGGCCGVGHYEYNMVGSGGARYLVQQNMDVVQQGCVTQAGGTVGL